MRILSAADMAATDARSGLPLDTLIARAGAAVAAFCLRQYPQANEIVILAGKGNNAADGIVAAHALAAAGRDVRLALLHPVADLNEAPRRALAAFPFIELTDAASLAAALHGADLVLDAIVGTGFQPPLRGPAATARDLVNQSAVPVVAIDLPSGWDADSTAQTSEHAVRADAVITFIAPKLAHIFGQLTNRTFGPVVVASLGVPEAAIISTTRLHWAGSSHSITQTPRNPNGNKGQFGHVLLIGGAFGKAGAPAMASLAALRAGAGLVTAAVPREILPTVAAIAPELMLTPLAAEAHDGSGGLALAAVASPALDRLLHGITVVALGPGLGQEPPTPEWVRTFLERVALPVVPLPTVLDADALNAITPVFLDELMAADPSRTLVLTPHPGEMARLCNLTVPQVEADRLSLARRFATTHRVTLVLKGWRTLIAHPDGRIAISTTGNPAMAKGGSGDILTGVVAALLAQYANAKHSSLTPDRVASAVEAAVFLHGLAGDFATLTQEEHTVLATDTVAHLWQAFRSRTHASDVTWLTGLAASSSSTASSA